MAELPKRTLGKTGLDVSVFSLGGVTYNLHDDAHAAAVVNRAIDLGVNYIDTGYGYSDSERKIGLVMADRRDEVHLATKSNARDYDGMKAHVEESLQRLQTDHIDCYQIHDLGTEEQLAQITGPNGALKALEEARRDGSVRFVGVTGHRNPEILARALQEYPFDTLLVSLGAMHAAVRPFYETVMPVAQERGVGVLAMKVMAYGWLAEMAEAAVRFVLSLPGVSTAVVGVDDVAELEQDVLPAREFRPIAKSERDELLETAREIYWKRSDEAWFIHL
jgi:aryl-alcohol dehydrogenase-like predicted oxidoreductase